MDLEYIKRNPEMVVRYMASKRFNNFARYIKPHLEVTDFHKAYYEVLDRFAKGEIKKLIVSCPPQHGKLLSDNELVPTPKGFVKHGDLKVGDYVLGRDGEKVKVLWVSPKDRTQYLVRFSDGAEIECHGRHEWVVYSRRLRREVQLETEEMIVQGLWTGEKGTRGSRAMFKVDANPIVHFESQEVPIEPYLLGAWLGDGNGGEGLIHIGCDDTAIVEGFDFHERKGSTTRPFYSPTLNASLKKAGLLGHKSIPDEYVYNDVEVRKSLIAGLIDTDGYVYPKNGRVTISNTNEEVVRKAALILRSLGQSVVVCKYAPKKSSSGIEGRKHCYQLGFNPTIEFPTRLERKKIEKLTKNKMRSIVSIEKIDGQSGNCIQVEGGIYLVGETFIPTHNSEASSRLLPAFLLGRDPDKRIVIGSYNADTAKSFNYDVQKIINCEQYRSIFPDSYLNTARVRMANVYKCNSEVSEMVGHVGSLRAVGRSGSLTGKSVDISILDDVYKDFNEANSGLIREQAWKWYTTVVRTRLHNDSQELIVFTRWHEDDLIGRLEKSGEKIIVMKSWKDLENIPKGAWVHFNFPALKMGKPTEIDPRNEGEALWEAKHSREKLLQSKALDPIQFECLYQGDPCSAEGRLYGEFKTYSDKKEWGTLIRKGCYVDVADQGSDDLCSITYDVYRSPNATYNEKKKRFEPIIFILVTDIILTSEGTDVTYVSVPNQINLQGVQKAWVESNNGGQQFGKTIAKKVKANVELFYSGANKETRIITNASAVMQSIIMPMGWENRYEKAYTHLQHFLRTFKANAHDDIEDTLTGIVEKEVLSGNIKPYSHSRRGIRRAN